MLQLSVNCAQSTAGESVCGWYVPTKQMNKGKLSEYKDRKEYEVEKYA